MIAILAVLILAAESCAMVHQYHENHTLKGVNERSFTPQQSWDQANLKRNDSGCPTAIYVAPGGNLSPEPCL